MLGSRDLARDTLRKLKITIQSVPEPSPAASPTDLASDRTGPNVTEGPVLQFDESRIVSAGRLALT